MFVGSLALPAVEVSVLGKPSVFPGWLAAWWGTCMGFGAVVDAFSHPTSPITLFGFVALGTSALFNVVLLVPLAWLRRTRARSPSRRLLMSWSLGTLLAMLAPFAYALGVSSATMLVGYFVWLAAWWTLGASLLVARREAAALTP